MFRRYYSITPNVSPHFLIQNKLKTLINRHKIPRVVVVFDGERTKAAKFGQEGYDKGRKPMDAEMHKHFRKTVNTLSKTYCVVQRQDYEADDIIGCIALYTYKRKKSVLIYSNDKDFFQLVRKPRKHEGTVVRIDVLRDLRGELLFDYDAVSEKYGFPPEQFTTFLALNGDSVDNIPGIRGLGPVTAQTLLCKYTLCKKAQRKLGLTLLNYADLPSKLHNVNNKVIFGNIAKTMNLVSLDPNSIPLQDLKTIIKSSKR